MSDLSVIDLCLKLMGCLWLAIVGPLFAPWESQPQASAVVSLILGGVALVAAVAITFRACRAGVMR
jgi:hypothetical protein